MISSLSKRTVTSAAVGLLRRRTRIGMAKFSSSSSTLDVPNATTDATDAAFSSPYEYPNRNEVPEITATRAKEVVTPQALEAATSLKRYAAEDPFDDARTLSLEEQEIQKRRLQETFHQNKKQWHCSPILSEPPTFVPPNVPSKELSAPETIVTQLDNGIRVVSQETYGQMTTFGLLTGVGSRHETKPGIVHALETMAFGTTEKYDGMAITQLLQDWGATRFVSHSREQTLQCIDMLRPNVERGMELLAQVVLEPKFSETLEEFYFALDTMAFQAQEQMPQIVLGEALQLAAYGADQQLGKLHFNTMETLMELSPPLVDGFYQDAIRNNPQQMVVAGAGIAHDSLVELALQHFGDVKQQSAPATIPSQYCGGVHIIPHPTNHEPIFDPSKNEKFCHVALAFPVGGWHSETSMVTACVLQMLLGGGSSFSAGGPGKGMYTRMYRIVLNQYAFIESAEAFTAFADEGGLLGVSGSTSNPKFVADMVFILADQLGQLAKNPVSPVELARARNMLKCNVLTQLESRLVLFEDMGRQLLTYGKREDATTTCAKIDAVSAQDIQSMAREMLKSNPTFAATGHYVEGVPDHSEICRWFQQYK